jgi:hypothetical protein
MKRRILIAITLNIFGCNKEEVSPGADNTELRYNRGNLKGNGKDLVGRRKENGNWKLSSDVCL